MAKWFWKMGHLIASMGCRLNGGHMDDIGIIVNGQPRDRFCGMCGRRKW